MWEYKRGIELDNDQLANFGRSGWELISVLGPVRRIVVLGSDAKGYSVNEGPAEGVIVFYFKRPAQPAG